jgi:putative hemolysin
MSPVEILELVALGLALGAWMLVTNAEAMLGEAAIMARTPAGAQRLGPVLYDLRRHPRRLVISLALGRELALVSAAVLAAVLAFHRAGLRGGIAALAIVAVALVILRGAAAGAAARRVQKGRALFGPALGWLLAPLRSLAAVEKSLGRRLAHAFLGEAPSGENIFAPDELATLSEEGVGEQELADAERTLVAKAANFGERSVRHILTPRRDLIAVPLEVAPEELLRVIHESGCSRIPVYRGEREDIVGILYVKDLIGQQLVAGGIEPLLRQPYVVPADTSVGDLLREFRVRKVHIALVVDEYQSLVGLVTMEDILEELFGEIRDEFDDDEEPTIRRRGPRTFLVSGRVSVSAFNDRLKVNIPPSGDEATIAGVVIDRLGHVPEPGEAVQMDGLTLTVEKRNGPAIELLRVDVWPSPSSS